MKKEIILITFFGFILASCQNKEDKNPVVEVPYTQKNCDSDKDRFHKSISNLGPMRAAFALNDCIEKLNDAEAISLKKNAEIQGYIAEFKDKEIPIENRIDRYKEFTSTDPEESKLYKSIEKELINEYQAKKRKLDRLTNGPSKEEAISIEKTRLAEARKKGVYIGMDRQQVIESSWGKPIKINRTTNAYSVHEQWVYGSGNYLYFENGLLTSIQN